MCFLTLAKLRKYTHHFRDFQGQKTITTHANQLVFVLLHNVICFSANHLSNTLRIQFEAKQVTDPLRNFKSLCFLSTVQ